jgi:hypothetical protein
MGLANARLRLELALLPAASLAVTVIVLLPTESATLHENADEVKLAEFPLHATFRTPDKASLADP